MPIAAADPAAFRALILDLPVLLAGKGRKAYIHHTPNAGEVAALQESNWQFESQFPGSYHEDVVTQQWGCPLGQSAPLPDLRIQDRFLNMITSGKKSLEVRVGYAHIRAIKPGASIRFVANAGQMLCSVADVRSYRSLESMIRHEDVGRALPGLAADEALAQTAQDISAREGAAGNRGAGAISACRLRRTCPLIQLSRSAKLDSATQLLAVFRAFSSCRADRDNRECLRTFKPGRPSAERKHGGGFDQSVRF